MGKTVRVRIAVAVDSGGDWTAYGARGLDDAESEQGVWEHGIDGDGAVATVFVEADIPVPPGPTIEGTVTGDGA